MSLSPGQKLAHYEIVESIGAGGMGEVYRARDTTLGRDVAIKVLPDEFSYDPERLARFQREARLLAPKSVPRSEKVGPSSSSAFIRPTLSGATAEAPIASSPSSPSKR